MEELNLWLVGGGLFIGALFGIVLQRSQFCMVAATSNIVLMRDFRHAHAYLAAIAVAVLGTFLLEAGGWVAIADTGYRVSRFDWPVIFGGGLLFGFGSMLAGGCAGRTTVRVAEGNLGALVVLLAFALMAAATYYGALAPYRAWLTQNTAVQLASGDSSLSAVLNAPFWVGPALIAAACLSGLIFLGRGSRSLGLIATGVVVGALVVAGWFVTGYLSQDDFSEHRSASITIAGPLARATVFLTSGSFPGYGFSVAVLIGTLSGAAASALATRSFHWVLPEAHQLVHLLVGGALMGIGAICAGGCNIGNGLTGVSTGSVKALTAVTGIVTGMLLGLSFLQHTEKAASRTDHHHRPLHGANP